MKKIVIIGANNFQMPLIKKAKQLGYETHVFAWADGAVGAEFADYFYPISIIEKEKILEKCKEIKPDAITSVASDLATLTVNYLAEKLGLAGNSLECTKISTNKYEMRKAFQKYGVSVPKFFEISDVNDLSKIKEMKTPIIIKPTDRSGSRSITKIEDLSDEEKLKTAIRDAIEVSKLLYPNKKEWINKVLIELKAIVEEYIDGDEFSAEGITYNGKHTILTITRKQTTGAPHFIETGHTEPAGLSNEMQEKVKKEVIAGLNSLKIKIVHHMQNLKLHLKEK